MYPPQFANSRHQYVMQHTFILFNCFIIETETFHYWFVEACLLKSIKALKLEHN